jgi:hypothetical protein
LCPSAASSRVGLGEVAGFAACVAGGHHDVDAVGLSADLLVDPRELDLELLGREGEGAQHAEAARLGDGGDHVAAMAEREDRDVDAERVA